MKTIIVPSYYRMKTAKGLDTCFVGSVRENESLWGPL